MQRHIEIAKMFGVPVVVAINQFHTDTPKEVEVARKAALAAGAEGAVMSDHWAQGGKGAVELAKAVMAACEKPNDFKLLYPDSMPIKQKIETIAKKVYRADGVTFDALARTRSRHTRRPGCPTCPSAWPRRTCRCRTTPR